MIKVFGQGLRTISPAYFHSLQTYVQFSPGLASKPTSLDVVRTTWICDKGKSSSYPVRFVAKTHSGRAPATTAIGHGCVYGAWKARPQTSLSPSLLGTANRLNGLESRASFLYSFHTIMPSKSRSAEGPDDPVVDFNRPGSRGITKMYWPATVNGELEK